MKRFISLFLAFVMAVTAITFTNTISYASEKIHIEDALEDLQTTTGYIPGKTAAVTNNCFAFICSVCEKLYGVSYYYEIQNGNYLYEHTSDYYTVASKTFSYSSSSSTRKTYASQIKEWFLENAAPGDIIQFGCADSSYSKKHTVMLQSIDNEKIQFYHSNYETSSISSKCCRVDTIYWSDFLNDPTKNVYDGDDIVSLCRLLGSGLELSGGYGISINRYSNLQSKYYLDKYVSTTPKITSITRSSTTSLKVNWNSVVNAQKYRLRYKVSTSTSWTTLSSSITDTSYDVKSLSVGTEYDFSVRAYVDGKWCDYSATVSKKCLPPTPATITVTSQSSTGLVINWVTRSDITGYKLYRCDSENGTYSLIATISNKSTSSYTDSTVEYNKTYYYKLKRYVVIGSVTYDSPLSTAIKGKYTLSQIEASYKRKTSTSVKVSWKSVDYATSYIVTCTDTVTNKVITKEITSCKYTFTSLVLGRKYTFSVSSKNCVGTSSSVTKTMKALPPKPSKPSVSLTSKGIKLKWSVRDDINGVKIYRSTKKSSGYKLIKTIENTKTKSYTDKDIEYSTKYYYKISYYTLSSNGKAYSGSSSSAVSCTMKLSSPSVTVNRKTVTSLNVSWNTVKYAKRYRVAYRLKGTKKYTYISTTNTSITISKLVTGKKYDIKVCAVNKIGSSKYCKIQTIKVMPATQSVKAQKGKSSITLTWKKPKTITGYEIYKRTGSGKYVLIKTIKSSSKVTYKDKSVKKNNTYYYKVRSYYVKNSKIYYGSLSKAAKVVY